MQIVGTWDVTTKWNPTNDPTVKPMPTGSYNAELVKTIEPGNEGEDEELLMEGFMILTRRVLIYTVMCILISAS